MDKSCTKIHESLGFFPVAVMWPCDRSQSIKTGTQPFCPDRRLQKAINSSFKKSSRRNKNLPGKITMSEFFFSSHGKEVVNGFPGKLLKEGERVAWIRWAQIKIVLSAGFANEMTVITFSFLSLIYFRQDLECMSRPTDTALNQFCQVVCHSVRQQILDKTDTNILIYCNQLRQQNIHCHLGLKAVLI